VFVFQLPKVCVLYILQLLTRRDSEKYDGTVGWGR